jgi:hypothetical protein
LTYRIGPETLHQELHAHGNAVKDPSYK